MRPPEDFTIEDLVRDVRQLIAARRARHHRPYKLFLSPACLTLWHESGEPNLHPTPAQAGAFHTATRWLNADWDVVRIDEHPPQGKRLNSFGGHIPGVELTDNEAEVYRQFREGPASMNRTDALLAARLNAT
jgi:hypothetical protein